MLRQRIPFRLRAVASRACRCRAVARPTRSTYDSLPLCVSSSHCCSWFSTAAEEDTTVTIMDNATTSSAPRETGLYRLLDAEQRQILQEQRALVAQVRQLARHQVFVVDNSTAEGSSILEESAFCIVLAGEFNAGKTTILNALLGARVLETGALPTTDAITILSAAAAPEQQNKANASSVEYHCIPDSDLLQDLTLVDTPGTNAVLLDHTATTLRLLPSADLILFCTSADRPFPESERQLLATMAADYRKRIVVLVNKMDLLETAGGNHGQAEKQRVVDFVTEHTRTWLGAQPLVLAISSKEALAAKLNHKTPEALAQSSLWQRSQFGQLEAFLRSSLTTKTKIQAKLLNPIGLVEKQLQDCLQKLSTEQEDLQTDVATLQLLQSQVQAWQNELERQMQQTRQDVQTSWQQEANRGLVLLRRVSLADYYQATLLGDTKQLQRFWQETSSLVTHVDWTEKKAIQAWIDETAQGLAVRSRAQGQALMEFLGTRPSSSRQNQSLVGHVLAASRFEQVQESLTQQLQQAVERHDVAGNKAQVNTLLRQLSQWTQISFALHSGALSMALATSLEWLDVWMGAGSGAVLVWLGAAALMQGRQQAVHKYHDNWTRRGQALDETLEQIGAQAMAKVHRRIQDGIAPYQQFVQAEQERLQQLEAACQEAQVTARRLRNRIGKL